MFLCIFNAKSTSSSAIAALQLGHVYPFLKCLLFVGFRLDVYRFEWQYGQTVAVLVSNGFPHTLQFSLLS